MTGNLNSYSSYKPDKTDVLIAGQRIKRTISLDRKIACLTLDFELDYGDRTGDFNILKDNIDDISRLADAFREFETPVSAFARTDIFETYPEALDAAKNIASDFHTHSHTHNTVDFNSHLEFSQMKEAFHKTFGYYPIGYRAPQGVLYEGDVERLRQEGFLFSSSVFPSYRPGKFNNMKVPLSPFIYENGLLEIPIAAVPGIRYTISSSYMKLLGYSMNKLIWDFFGLPNILLVDMHLHDFIVNPKSFSKLPVPIQVAYSINKTKGILYISKFIKHLKKLGYQFFTVTDLYESLQDKMGGPQ